MVIYQDFLSCDTVCPSLGSKLNTNPVDNDYILFYPDCDIVATIICNFLSGYVPASI